MKRVIHDFDGESTMKRSCAMICLLVGLAFVGNLSADEFKGSSPVHVIARLKMSANYLHYEEDGRLSVDYGVMDRWNLSLCKRWGRLSIQIR